MRTARSLGFVGWWLLLGRDWAVAEAMHGATGVITGRDTLCGRCTTISRCQRDTLAGAGDSTDTQTPVSRVAAHYATTVPALVSDHIPGGGVIHTEGGWFERDRLQRAALYDALCDD